MLLCSCVVCFVLTMLLGFTWGGWVTGGTAKEMTESAVEDTRAELAAAVCVDRFLKASDVGARLASLREIDSWNRSSFMEKEGWVTLRGTEDPVPEAGDLCAEQLMEAKLSPLQDAAPGDSAAVKN